MNFHQLSDVLLPFYNETRAYNEMLLQRSRPLHHKQVQWSDTISAGLVGLTFGVYPYHQTQYSAFNFLIVSLKILLWTYLSLLYFLGPRSQCQTRLSH